MQICSTVRIDCTALKINTRFKSSPKEDTKWNLTQDRRYIAFGKISVKSRPSTDLSHLPLPPPIPKHHKCAHSNFVSPALISSHLKPYFISHSNLSPHPHHPASQKWVTPFPPYLRKKRSTSSEAGLTHLSYLLR